MQFVFISRTILVMLLWSVMTIFLSAQPQIRVTSKGQIEHVNTGSSVFIGQDAGDADDMSANNNVFIGYQSGKANTTGGQLCAVGYGSLFSNTSRCSE